MVGALASVEVLPNYSVKRTPVHRFRFPTHRGRRRLPRALGGKKHKGKNGISCNYENVGMCCLDFILHVDGTGKGRRRQSHKEL
jgi:hypothetical protein